MIKMTVTRRGLIRLCSLTIAAVAALGVRNIQLMNDVDNAQRTVVYNYSRAVEDLADSCDNLSAALEKQLYAGTGAMHQSLAVELYKEASTAKAALSQLPIAELNLENTYKFLSQVGNYSLSVSQKLMNGGEISDEEYKNMTALYDYSKKLSDDMWTLEGALSGGGYSLTKAKNSLSENEPPYITDGFSDFEDTFDNYPSLIYDGPFSDNILEKTPKMTSNAQEVTKDKALQKAAMALNVNTTTLTKADDVEGNMPAWRFSDDNSTMSCEVTKNGGYLSYLLKMRAVENSNIDKDKALQSADDFLDYLGILSMEETYHEIEGNVMTVNYAYSDLGTRVYPDLVKVSVAMDNGEILGYDARGFLVNHTDRSYPEDLFSEVKAEQLVSPKLTISSKRMAVIPTDNLEEKLCYEFACKAENGRSVLVYINAETGEEEDILILIESDAGTLAE